MFLHGFVYIAASISSAWCRPLAIVSMVFIFSFAAAEARAGETCSEGWGLGQYFDDLSVCVSSALSPEGGYNYRPENLFDTPENAWCEGVAGDGLGETITFRFTNASFPIRFLIKPGYAKSAAAFQNNGRPLRLLMRNDAGGSQLVELFDTPKEQAIPVPWQAGTVNWISFEILSVRPGRKYHDTCISWLFPDYEGF